MDSFWPREERFALEVMEQFLGLANAIEQLQDKSCRHGDVKPDDIPRFKDETIIGLLKLGDMGLTKQHGVNTALRPDSTITKFGTPRYEAPEVDLHRDEPRSRLYDIWSLGCVFIELII